MLSLERLRALCAVADYGSIAAAAEALHVTPSGVSQQLNKLEREVGVGLLMPAGRGIQLTDAGRLLAQRGAEVLSMLSALESEVVTLNRDIVGELRVGSFVSISRRVAPTAIAHLCAQYPQLKVTFVAGETENLLPAIERRELDLAVADNWMPFPPRRSPGVSLRFLHRDAADVALPAAHELANRSFIDLDEIADMPWVMWRQDSVFEAWLVHTLRSRGVEPEIRYRVPEYAGELAFVAHGLAAALVPRLAQTSVPSGVALVPVRPTLEREIYAMHRRDNDRPSVQAGIAAFTRAFAGEDPRNADSR